jgi:predicted RNA-binding Zn-ribbon protein involved in translation (DUF1610 family)
MRTSGLDRTGTVVKLSAGGDLPGYALVHTDAGGSAWMVKSPAREETVSWSCGRCGEVMIVNWPALYVFENLAFICSGCGAANALKVLRP